MAQASAASEHGSTADSKLAPHVALDSERPVVTTTSQPSSAPPGERRSFFSEGVLLAATPAAAYALAFNYENGWANYFGYPNWMIDVTWIGVLIAWGVFALALGIV